MDVERDRDGCAGSACTSSASAEDAFMVATCTAVRPTTCLARWALRTTLYGARRQSPGLRRQVLSTLPWRPDALAEPQGQEKVERYIAENMELLPFVPILNGPLSLPESALVDFFKGIIVEPVIKQVIDVPQDIAAVSFSHKVPATSAADGGRAGGSTYSSALCSNVDHCWECTGASSTIPSSASAGVLAWRGAS